MQYIGHNYGAILRISINIFSMETHGMAEPPDENRRNMHLAGLWTLLCRSDTPANAPTWNQLLMLHLQLSNDDDDERLTKTHLVM